MGLLHGTGRTLLGGRVLWLPTDLAGLQLWLRADAGTYQDAAKATPAVSDGDVVGAWEDQSGNGNDVSQSTTAKKPTLKRAIIKGKPVVRFDGTDDEMERANVLGSDLFSADEATIFVVQLQDGAQAGNTTLCWDAPDTRNRVNCHLSFADTLYFDFGDISGGGRINGAQPAGWDDAFHVVELYRAADGSGEIVVDGTVEVSDTFTDDLDNTQTATLFLASTGGGNFLKGDIAEVIIYSRALSATERLQVHQHLSSKYGIV